MREWEKAKTRALRPGFSTVLRFFSRQASGDGAAKPRAHQADRVEIGLFPGALLGALARLIALVEQLDLLELLESLAQEALGIFKLDAQLIGGPRQVFPALDRGLGVGRIGEVRGIVDPGALLLALDFALEVDRT